MVCVLLEAVSSPEFKHEGIRAARVHRCDSAGFVLQRWHNKNLMCSDVTLEIRHKSQIYKCSKVIAKSHGNSIIHFPEIILRGVIHFQELQVKATESQALDGATALQQ